jgi:hypothetical protein
MLASRVRTDGFVAPCIPSLAHKPPAGPEWIHEIKHYGNRLIVRQGRRLAAARKPFRRSVRRRGEVSSLAGALLRHATTYVMPTRVPQFMARTIRPHMPMVGEYRRYAAECLTLRAMITGSRQRAVLLSMAVAWSDLSEMAEKNEQNDIVYETPTGRASATLH